MQEAIFLLVAANISLQMAWRVQDKTPEGKSKERWYGLYWWLTVAFAAFAGERMGTHWVW